MRNKMNFSDFSKCLQWNKEWTIKGGLNMFRTHCITCRLISLRLDAWKALLFSHLHLQGQYSTDIQWESAANHNVQIWRAIKRWTQRSPVNQIMSTDKVRIRRSSCEYHRWDYLQDSWCENKSPTLYPIFYLFLHFKGGEREGERERERH